MKLPLDLPPLNGTAHRSRVHLPMHSIVLLLQIGIESAYLRLTHLVRLTPAFKVLVLTCTVPSLSRALSSRHLPTFLHVVHAVVCYAPLQPTCNSFSALDSLVNHGLVPSVSPVTSCRTRSVNLPGGFVRNHIGLGVFHIM